MKNDLEIFYDVLLEHKEDILNIQTNEFDLNYFLSKFHSQSFKVYYVQDNIKLYEELLDNIVISLLDKNIVINKKLGYLKELIHKGTEKNFELSHNEKWLFETSDMMHAYLQCYLVQKCLVNVVSSTTDLYSGLQNDEDFWFLAELFGLN